MERRDAIWDERRWGPPPPPTGPARSRCGDRPLSLVLAAVASVAAEALGVATYSVSGTGMGVLSILVAAWCAWGLLDGRRWGRRSVVTVSALHIVALLAVAAGSGEVGVWLRIELLMRGAAAVFVLGAVSSPSATAYAKARWIERLG